MTSITDRRGFTLIELTVVVLLLALMAGITVPRLVGQEKRVLNHAADEVADLLMMYAQRAAHAQRPAGIALDPDGSRLSLLVLDIDAARPDEPAEWRIDPFVRPVRLPELADDGVLAFAAGERVDIAQWPISSFPGQERDTVEIRLIAGDGSTRSIVLPGHAIVPFQVERTDELLAQRQPVDLDQAGRNREDW